ncbi:threonine--tRNA ligase [Bacillus nakamurai]|uniref:Threonine--tRNA ligase n=1 Tax=Bacillus nakamurai TaxID=1793963 RepID=A0A150F9H8_9BACI|nr:threonine--tRNA ligase [Bacillus nakamurai]KXZ21767.1 threonine--tRNA ligase [Bacillus nakamurai]MED1226645.1 threonine--tRNA ligase [Bacillus nakamurai]
MNQEYIVITFPDGNQKEYPKGVTLEEIAQSISLSVKKTSAIGKVNGLLYDLKRSICEDAAIELCSLQSEAGLEVMRHTAAHVLAQAVKRLYKDVHLGIGPVIDNGFYYDFNMKDTVTEQDLAAIEKEMNRIISEQPDMIREEISREKAKEMFAHDPLKLELLEEIPHEETVSIYRQGEFTDLCRGPHLPSAGFIKAFSLTHVSGAYWRGDSNRKVLQRIYGTAFASKKELKQHFQLIKEAEKRNHRKLGAELDLFMFSEEAPGMPFYLPNGQFIRNTLESFLRNLQDSYHYQEVRTPMMMNQRLWERSGHWDHYKENMYFSDVDHQRFALKPMNCPGHMLMFKDKLRSYRDLPIRIAEFGQVHRHEFSGALNGLLRVRSFCQDDAHIFVTPNQIEAEIASALQIIDEVYSTFDFSYDVELSTRPDHHMGSEELWDQAEGALENVLKKLGYDYHVNQGDGAFYGPKIDIHIKDALNRSHQCATVQLDFQMPEKFDLTYIDEENQKVRPVVIHRAVFGSLDRFLGIIIEHFGGAFPLWLAPVQVKIIPVSHAVHQEYAEEVQLHLKKRNIRAELDVRDEKLGYKIREAQMKKIPYLAVVGDRERGHQSVHVRQYGKESSFEVQLADFISQIKDETDRKTLLQEK